MREKIKRFFNNEKKVSVLFFSVIMIAAVFFITGNGVLAYFTRDAADSSFSYGYGYGGSAYGYGYGYGYGANASSGNEDYGFWGADGKATSVSAARVSNSGLAVSYSTSYYAKNKVYYGTSNTGTCSTLASVSSQTAYQTGSQSITISDLSCATTYYFCVASEDAGDNTWYTSIYEMPTGVCSGGGGGGGGGSTTPTPTPTTQTTVANVTADSGGTVSLETTEGNTIQVVVPAQATESDIQMSVQSSQSSVLEANNTVGSVPSSLGQVGSLVFNITASQVGGGGAAVSTFSKEITLTFSYTDAQVKDIDEATLKVYKWISNAWQALGGIVNTQNNTVTVNVSSLSYFSIMGSKIKTATSTPVVPLTLSELKAKIRLIITQLIPLIQELLVKLQQDLLQLTTGEVKLQMITVNLKFGAQGEAVKLLQAWLAKDKEIYPEGTISGYFGKLTEKAVIKFQEKYVNEILAPFGLKLGNGFVGSATRAKLNGLFGSQ